MHDILNESLQDQKSDGTPKATVDIEELECDIDEDLDDEHYSDKNINNTFINKLKDFSTFNPSGNKGSEKNNNSMMIIPVSTIDMRRKARNSNVDSILGLAPVCLTKEHQSVRN